MPRHEVPEQHWVSDDENRDNAIDAALEDLAGEILLSQADHALSSGDDSEEESGADNNGEGQREGTATPDKQQKRYRGADGLARTAGGVEWEMELETEERRQASVEELHLEGDQQLDKTAQLQQLHEPGTEAYPNSPIQKDGRANHQSRESDHRPKSKGTKRRHGSIQEWEQEGDQQLDQTAKLKHLQEQLLQIQQDALHQQKKDQKQQRDLQRQVQSLMQAAIQGGTEPQQNPVPELWPSLVPTSPSMGVQGSQFGRQAQPAPPHYMYETWRDRASVLQEEVAKGRRNRKRLDTILAMQRDMRFIHALQSQCED
jgi:hypothetical protein